MRKEELYKKAIHHYGQEKQINQAMEELAELTQAINKLRNQLTKEHYKNVVEEIADVEIMLEQLKIIFKLDNDEIQIAKDEKLIRLENRILKAKKYEANT